jgi:hypothetical protein
MIATIIPTVISQQSGKFADCVEVSARRRAGADVPLLAALGKGLSDDPRPAAAPQVVPFVKVFQTTAKSPLALPAKYSENR